MLRTVDHEGHAPDPVNFEVRSTVNKIKNAAEISDDKTRNVITNNIGKLSDEASAHLPSISSLSRTVQNIRSKKIEAFPIQNGLEGMVIPEIYKKTDKDKQFLMYDSEDGKNRFLMFCTSKNLKILKKCSFWQADGTFKCVPVLFGQLYTIHGKFEYENSSKTLPLVFFLLPNKNKKTYKAALSVLKEKINDFQPEEIIVDFEIAFYKTFGKLFENTRIKGCHFHFGQCAFGHVKMLGLQQLYSEDILFMSAIKMLIALAFVPVEDVVYTYELLISSVYFIENEELLNEYLNYFERTWIGVRKRNITRSEPLFAIEMWNCYDYVMNDRPRTNNVVEGWHNGFSRSVGKHHPEMGPFINCLKKEQNLNELLIEQVKSGRDVAGPRRKKYKDYDTRLKNVAISYDKDNVLEYLKNVSVLVVL